MKRGIETGNFGLESPPAEKEPSEKDESKIEGLIEQMAKNLIEQGVPVSEKDCRIDMNSFDKGAPYSSIEIQRDRKAVRTLEKEWYGNLPEEKIKKEKEKRGGERLKMLKTIIFHKFIGKDFLVVRTSSYDDIQNKVDNLIVDKKTGDPVCAYDELLGKGSHDKRFETKRTHALEINIQRGAKIKYGITLKEGKIVKTPLKGVPIFHLTWPSQKLKEAIEMIDSSLEEKTPYEQKIFHYFTNLMKYQVDLLKQEHQFKELTERIIQIENFLSKIKS